MKKMLLFIGLFLITCNFLFAGGGQAVAPPPPPPSFDPSPPAPPPPAPLPPAPPSAPLPPAPPASAPDRLKETPVVNKNEPETKKPINAQTAIANGIAAQNQGAEITALYYYFLAAELDPSLKEAADRSSELADYISSGIIGMDTQNDIQWRKAWMDRLTETEQLFDNLFKTSPLPYTLFYSTSIKQGEINYQTETATLSIETRFHGSQFFGGPLEKVMRTVFNGLESTKRVDVWELGNWSWKGVTNLKPFDQYRKNISVTAELVNNRNKVIGSNTFQAQGTWGFTADRFSEIKTAPIFEVSRDDNKTVSFTNVKTVDITDNLIIRIVQVNGTDAQTAVRNGVLQIIALPADKWDFYNSFEIENRQIIKYNGKGGDLVIETIWGETIYRIREKAFLGKQITSVVIPDTVTDIWSGAFQGNRLTTITIPANVSLGYYDGDSFDYRFDDAYNKNDKQAGTYVLSGRTWTRK